MTVAIGDWGAWQLRYSREQLRYNREQLRYNRKNSSGTAGRTAQVQQGEQLRYSMASSFRYNRENK